ncbi:hypothetical protein [Bdellovibrio svalbardensis]|uniref:Uncharacterized protein n=1 Tax=Bdellovibrio svalbardensis TaxID=2972972 RepID=A0ABT6DED7_9BACT|nr:hypothetical protein [Bdellovibrio svalbardensis]MDG0815205.1 hypothetical protein [Bdellovibrio svalbardensis]
MSFALELPAYSRARDCRNPKFEKEAINLWNTDARPQIEDLINRRLLQEGDVYALYDVQIFLQNFLTMSARCQRTAQLNEIVRILQPSAKVLTLDPQDQRRKWICKGGDICRSNHLLNKEVFLVSVQFAGLISNTINTIAALPRSEVTPEMHHFLETFMPVIFEDHLPYWIDLYSSRWEKLAKLPRTEVPGNFRNAFDDKDMWLLTVLSEMKTADLKLGLASPFRPGLLLNWKMTKMYNQGIDFLRSRIDKATVLEQKKPVTLALFDLGAWSRYEDMAYAGHLSLEKPVVCEVTGSKTYRIPKDKVSVIPSVNMDISHARRLVPMFESLQRNEPWLVRAGGKIVDPTLRAQGLLKAVADGFAAKVMSPQRPLFHTYMDGTNGWYRVAYSSTGACREGDAPYSSSYAGPTGGFAFWADQNKKIGLRMLEVYKLLSSHKPEDKEVAEQYYGGIKKNSLQRFMFIPSLVNIVE